MMQAKKKKNYEKPEVKTEKGKEQKSISCYFSIKPKIKECSRSKNSEETLKRKLETFKQGSDDSESKKLRLFEESEDPILEETDQGIHKSKTNLSKIQN